MCVSIHARVRQKVAVRLFNRLNSRDLRVPIDDAFDLVRTIADGLLRDVSDIAARLRPWMVELSPREET